MHKHVYDDSNFFSIALFRIYSHTSWFANLFHQAIPQELRFSALQTIANAKRSAAIPLSASRELHPVRTGQKRWQQRYTCGLRRRECQRKKCSHLSSNYKALQNSGSCSMLCSTSRTFKQPLDRNSGSNGSTVTNTAALK
jgi:hypothetical protein